MQRSNTCAGVEMCEDGTLYSASRAFPPGQMIGVVTKSPKALASLEMIDAQKTHRLRGSDGETRQKNLGTDQSTEHQMLKHIYKCLTFPGIKTTAKGFMNLSFHYESIV